MLRNDSESLSHLRYYKPRPTLFTKDWTHELSLLNFNPFLFYCHQEEKQTVESIKIKGHLLPDDTLQF